jgi:peptide deformylase
MRARTGNLPPLPGIFPDYAAPIVRNQPDGILKRLAVIELAAADGVRTYVNPQIVWASADMIRHEEGSVSMPGVTEEIERHASISSMGSFGSIGSPG